MQLVHPSWGGQAWLQHMDVSENSVPLNPMVNDHYPILSLLNGYFIGNIPYFQTNPYYNPVMSTWDIPSHSFWSTCYHSCNPSGLLPAVFPRQVDGFQRYRRQLGLTHRNITEHRGASWTAVGCFDVEHHHVVQCFPISNERFSSVNQDECWQQVIKQGYYPLVI